MDFLYSDEPIVACSSGNNVNCAIAVIRFSGFADPNIFKPFLNLPFKNLQARRAYFCDLKFEGQLLDQVVATFFKAPSSYNGENILEISVHGNVLNVEKILSTFCEHSVFRRANPGEFTYRALKNKKLNLSQVEGLDLLLNANSEFALRQGFSLMKGSLQHSYIELQKSFLNHRSSIEFSMDFLEDMGEEQANKYFKETLNDLKTKIENIWHRVRSDSSKLINPEIVLVGQPNSGKSTFFNILVREERSIVTDIAGTTRDYITENINIAEVHYRLVDTAGLRSSDDAIEMEGVKRSLEMADRAFFRILLINPFEFDFEYFQSIKSASFDLIIFSHADRKGFADQVKTIRQSQAYIELSKLGPMGAKMPGPMGAENPGPMGANLKKINDFEWLASFIGNSDELVGNLNKKVNSKYLEVVKDEPILLQRHKQIILGVKEIFDEYCHLVENESDISIIASELNSMGHCFSELVGIVSPDDVLHNIFDNFCIGK